MTGAGVFDYVIAGAGVAPRLRPQVDTAPKYFA